MSKYVPLSLRRKIVIALDSDLLITRTTNEPNEAGSASAAENRFLAFKTVAWVKANIIRAEADHVFLVTAIDNSPTVDTATISAMWNSMFNDTETHADPVKEAETHLKRLAGALNKVGVSVSVDVVMGTPSEKVVEYVHRHKGEILVVQEPPRTAIAATFAYSWADLCAHAADCPTIVIRKDSLPENIAVALDPPPPTRTVDAASNSGAEEDEAEPI